MKKIKEFPKYSVTKDGKIYSYYTDKYLKPDEDGEYRRVTLRKDGEDYHRAIHILVATTYIKNPNNYPIVEELQNYVRDINLIMLFNRIYFTQGKI